MKYDLLLYNGNFIRFDKKINYNWIVVNKNIIIDAGYEEDLDKFNMYFDSSNQQIDLNGKTVLPGFYDSHVHFIQTALHLNNLDLNGTANYAELKDRISQWISKNPDNNLIIGYGLEISELEEKKFPNRRFLDTLSKEQAIFISSRDFHISALNTKAINMLHPPLTIEGVESDEKGNPTGVFYGKANALIRKRVLQSTDTSEKIDCIKRLSEQVIKKGVTSIHAVEGGFDFLDNDAELLYSLINELPFDVTLFYSTTDISKIRNKGMNRIGGDIFLDGSFTSFNAALNFNYNNENHNGTLYFAQEDLNEFILECYKNNLDTSLHAVGDRAVDQILKAHLYARSIIPNDKLRHRIEHAEITSKEQRQIVKDLGIIFSMQPAFEYFYGGKNSMYENRLGSYYTKTNQFRTLIDEGILICGGSDSDLTPIDPILGIHAAVNHPIHENRITVEEAVKMFTINPAYSVYEENIKGSIEIGKVADLVILEKDIFKINHKAIITTQVLGTMKNGSFIYKLF